MATTAHETDLRYPVGKFSFDNPVNESDRPQLIALIAETPGNLRNAVAGLSRDQLETPYRPGGWTIRQVVHHLADSHINAYVRMKLAATEDRPMVKTYDEQRWAELPEAKSASVEMSLALVDALHRRWTAFVRALAPGQRRRAFQHPEWGAVTIEESVTMYAWHCRHHAAHIERALANAGAAQR